MNVRIFFDGKLSMVVSRGDATLRKRFFPDEVHHDVDEPANRIVCVDCGCMYTGGWHPCELMLNWRKDGG
jgi:hypothetical protein